MKIESDFIAMLNLLGVASSGNEISIGEYNADNVLKYAKEQSVIPLVVSAMKNLGPQYNMGVLRMASKNIADLAYIRQIFNELESKNIKFAVLKGESVACFYKDCDLRISGDVDILIEESDEKKVLEVFSKYGYTYSERTAERNETVLIHPERKIVEVHVALYDKTREDIFFGDVANIEHPYMKMSTRNLGEFYALSPDDGICFLYLHFIKHFLSLGAGVRPLLDIVLYTKYYKDVINWDAFFEKITKIHYFDMYKYILSIAVKYMGFKTDDFPKIEYDFEKADKVLADLQYSGLFGNNGTDLAQFKRIYEEKRNKKYGFVNYEEYSKKYAVSKIKIIFPPYKVMRHKYNFLIKHSYLLPVAWFYRIVGAILKVILKKEKISVYMQINKTQTNEAVEKRIQLMEDINLI